jgi:hypothetical protein
LNLQVKYNWSKSKIAIASKVIRSFYSKNRNYLLSIPLELEDFEQVVFYRLLSVSGYKTDSMKLFRDDNSSLVGFVSLVCRRVLLNVKVKRDRRILKCREESLEGLVSYGSVEDFLPSVDHEMLMSKFRLAIPNGDVKGLSVTWTEFFKMFLTLSTPEIAMQLNVPVFKVSRRKNELVNMLRGV